MNRRGLLSATVSSMVFGPLSGVSYTLKASGSSDPEPPGQIFTHDYSPRDQEIVDYGFYESVNLPGMRLRGPAIDLRTSNNYITCIGAAQTLGVYVPSPFPALLASEFDVAVWNLGVGGASPSFFLQHPELIKYVNRGKFVILQMMTARDESNDRIKPTRIASIVRDTRRGDFTLAQNVWQRIKEEEPEKMGDYIEQSRRSWETHMRDLIDKIHVPILHFWFSPKALDAGIDPRKISVAGIIDTYPQFVNQDNLNFLRQSPFPLVTCFSDRNWEFDLRSRFTGEKVEVDYAVMDKTGSTPTFTESRNKYYPSAQMHWDASRAISKTIKQHALMDL